MSLAEPDTAALVTRSLKIGAINAVAFTLTPFYFWYRGIARCGVARTSICAFAEPLVATLFSLLRPARRAAHADADRRRRPRPRRDRRIRAIHG